MEIFKELNNLGYKQYLPMTVEELDTLNIDSVEFSIEANLAFDWFREKGFRFNIQSHRYTSVEFFMVELYDGKRRTELFGKSLTYEEARLECLKKLIEIIKNESK